MMDINNFRKKAAYAAFFLFSLKAEAQIKNWKISITPQIHFYNGIVECKAIKQYHYFETNNRLLFYPNGVDQDIGGSIFLDLSFKDIIISLGGGLSKVGYKFKYADNTNPLLTNSFTFNFDLFEFGAGFYYKLFNYPIRLIEQHNKMSVRFFAGLGINLLIDPQYVLYPFKIQDSIFTGQKINQSFDNNIGLGLTPKLKLLFAKKNREIVSLQFAYQFGLEKLEHLNLEFSIRDSDYYNYQLSTYGSYLSVSISKSFLLYKKK